MAEGQRSDAGGIRGLLELIDQHREAIEYDLIGHGLRLAWTGTPELSWRDLWVIVNQSPQGSALDRSMRPEVADWGLTEQLLAANLDATRVLIWQKTKDGQDGRNHPEPTPRPGIEPPVQTHGSATLPMDEMAAWLGWDKTT